MDRDDQFWLDLTIWNRSTDEMTYQAVGLYYDPLLIVEELERVIAAVKETIAAEK